MFDSNSEEWALRTFGKAELNDPRRTKRLVTISADMADSPGKSLVKAAKDFAGVEGAYRLIENDYIDAKDIAQTGFNATAQECSKRCLVLVIEDTTGLSYTHSVCKELGNNPASGKSSTKGRSLFLHSILAMDADTERVIGSSTKFYPQRKSHRLRLSTRKATQRGKRKLSLGKILHQNG